MGNSEYRPGNRGNEQSRLVVESSELQIHTNGHVKSATAYGTPDGIVVELYGNRTRTYTHPYEHQDSPQEKLVFTGGVDDEGQPSSPSTIRIWGNFDPIKHAVQKSRVRVTTVANLRGKEREEYQKLVEGSYRDDPNDRSSFLEDMLELLEDTQK